MFDTGGFTRWLPSSASQDEKFEGKTKYDINSPTRTSLNKAYETAYGGDYHEGNVVADELVIQGHCVPEFIFVEMARIAGSVDKREGYDGVFGMKRPKKTHMAWEFFNTTLIDYLVSADIVQDGRFTFRFCGQPGVRGVSWFERGDLVFGGIMADHHHMPIVYLPVFESKLWTIYADSISYGNIILCAPCRIAVDTGSPVTYAPTRSSQILLKNSVIEEYANGILHVEPRNLPYVREITVTLRSQIFTLPPAELLRYKSEVHVYGIQLEPDVRKKEWIFGISFLRRFLTIFDQQNNQMGFASVKC
ncbi:hypothetical protein T265_01716 [Opisthorchis viverrini]|uniref:Peptidase A1 domain-containing protein n=1 Tax=Opisthorchis viverrini TaxID=6198 RepID=A0A074ZYZ5_OPIVI|nr:hypothetical protein T265_01716 [Opisthorchis viverrini]KER32301.1 hypothetical protein T265_01716 [Opisthorchis viverrini]